MIRTFLAALILTLSCASGAVGQVGNAGTYLAARQAGFASDYRAAAEYYTRALVMDPGNPDLLEKALTAQVSLGRFDRAVPVMRRMQEAGLTSPLGNIVQLTVWMKERDFDALREGYEDGFSLGGLIDGLIRPWAAFGEGDLEAALDGFDTLSEQVGLPALATYHRALALAAAGEYAAADDILSGAQGSMGLTRRGLMAHLQILSQLGRNGDALALLVETLGNSPSPVFSAIAARLETGEAIRFDVAPDARAGMAEAFYTLAQALLGETANGLTLLYTRTAAELNPDHIDALLLSASLLEEEGQYDLATAAYDAVPRDHPAFLEAEFGRADALRFAGNMDAAVEVLQQLGETHPDLLQVHVALGDTLRRDDRWADAQSAYDRAIALIGTPTPQDWQIYFARGIVLERQDKWPEAETDFRTALQLSPDEPRVLNYLGYSMVEKRMNLDEALAMIERAVEQRPNDGYIVDSLGWVLYRLGRYEEAVEPMERAAELMAIDPVVNDHLGDVYWAVGRKREAEFQWRRALSFIDQGTSTEDVDPDRIRRKLEVGLDVVLKEEGAEALDDSDTDN